MPEMTPGKIRRTISMNTRELLLMPSSKPRNIRPTIPMTAEKITMITVQVMPIFADFFRSFWDFSDIKRMMMCGIPKYPRPQPSPETMSFQFANAFQ